MASNSFFNVRSLGTPPSNPQGVATRGGGQTPQNGFQSVTTTSEATLTFTAAPAAVTAVWKVLAAAHPPIHSLLWVPIGLSLLVGLLIYLQGRPSSSSGNQLPGLVFAVINSFTIAATVLGINQVVAPVPSGH